MILYTVRLADYECCVADFIYVWPHTHILMELYRGKVEVGKFPTGLLLAFLERFILILKFYLAKNFMHSKDFTHMMMMTLYSLTCLNLSHITKYYRTQCILSYSTSHTLT